MHEEFRNNAKTGRPLKYRVILSKQQRRKLVAMRELPMLSVQVCRANILLALDEGKYALELRETYENIAEKCGTCRETVYRTARRFIEHGLEAVLEAQPAGSKFSDDEEVLLKCLLESYSKQEKAWSIRGLARELGRAPATIKNALERIAREDDGYSGPKP